MTDTHRQSARLTSCQLGNGEPCKLCAGGDAAPLHCLEPEISHLIIGRCRCATPFYAFCRVRKVCTHEARASHV